MRKLLFTGAIFGIGLAALFANSTARAQAYGVELQNTLMPASGGMAGTSLAKPQDLMSAINGNPATMSQFEGTQCMFGADWAQPVIKFTQNAPLPLTRVQPYSADSETPGAVLGNVGVTQNFSAWGMPVTFGLGLASEAGGGVDFTRIPQSNGTYSELFILNFSTGMSMQVTDKLAIGTMLTLGEGFDDAPFAGVSTMSPAVAIRGTVGATYLLNPCTTVGAYYQTPESFRFRDAVLLNPPGAAIGQPRDVRMSMPDNIGFGIANHSLMDGCLLLAFDVTFKEWDNANLFKDVYKNQWIFSTGAQYTAGKYRYRAGYAYAENPITTINNVVIDGIPIADAVNGADYLQAQLAVINPHRLSVGLGVTDVLPGLDLDSFAGYMFRAGQDIGPTRVDINSYYLGFGLTWRFDACCAKTHASDCQSGCDSCSGCTSPGCSCNAPTCGCGVGG